MAMGVAQRFAAAISRAQWRKIEGMLEVWYQGERKVSGVEYVINVIAIMRAGFDDGL